MRPVVIHVNHLETLAELSSILKVSFTFATVHNDVSVVMTQSNHHWNLNDLWLQGLLYTIQIDEFPDTYNKVIVCSRLMWLIFFTFKVLIDTY